MTQHDMASVGYRTYKGLGNDQYCRSRQFDGGVSEFFRFRGLVLEEQRGRGVRVCAFFLVS